MRVADESFLPAIDLSPRGDAVAFVADDGGERRIFVQRFDEFDPVPLANTEGAEQPAFSPDGRWIAFFADLKLKRISVDGGPALIVCDAPSPRGLSWVNNDLIVFTPEQITPLMTVPAAGGTPTAITEMRLDGAEYSHRHPFALPDGDTILYARAAGSDWDTIDIWARRLSTGEDKRIMTGGAQTQYSPSGHLIHFLAGSLVATPFDAAALETTGPPMPLGHEITVQMNTGAAQFDIGPTGTIALIEGGTVGANVQLVRVTLDGEATPLSPDLRAFRMPCLSPDGKKVVIGAIAQGRGDLFIFDIERNIWTRQTFAGSVGAAWSPDSEWIYYADSTSGTWDIERRSITGGAPETVIKDVGYAPLLSAIVQDEQQLVFTAIADETRDDIMIAEREGDTWSVRPLLNQPYAETGGEISPDGRWLAYASDELGRYDVYVTDFPGCRMKRQISVDGGSEPVWSRDGERLYFKHGANIMRAAVNTDDGFTAARPERLFSTPYAGLIATGAASFDVLPEDQGFVMARPVAQDDSTPRVSVILNWSASLDRPR
jgi:serine/threonine-protein kinase